MAAKARGRETFHLALIKPTHYDDAGYPIQWWRTQMPSNSLACLYSLARDCARRHVLGPEVEIRITLLDETSERVPIQRLIDARRPGEKSLVGLVGVQTNQFPRAVDLARRFLEAGIPVCLGGFHVSGCLSTLTRLPDEIAAAQAAGISLFAGEAEGGRFERVLEDAYHGRLAPLYNYLGDVPPLAGQPTPFLPKESVARTYSAYSAFDLGRGCPFTCTFCTIINVQGRRSRFRTTDDLERIVRSNHQQGITRFFLTDDNLARNRNWEAFFDRLIWLRRVAKIEVRLLAQVDMESHRIPGFVPKAVAAGVDQLFMGLESINAENLKSVGKHQNRVSAYREALLAWKRHPVVITAGYILGFAHDTPASILEEIETVKRELPVDALYFFFLTPLPGSVDHQRQCEQGAFLDPDANRYDLHHRVTHHGRMSDAEWEQAYRAAWRSFYTFEHMETILRRMIALRSNRKFSTVHRLVMYREFVRCWGVHALEGGLVRICHRRDRRPGLPLEPRTVFYPKYLGKLLSGTLGILMTYGRLRRMLRRLWRDPHRFQYRDAAIAPAFERPEPVEPPGALRAPRLRVLPTD